MERNGMKWKEKEEEDDEEKKKKALLLVPLCGGVECAATAAQKDSGLAADL